MSGGDAGPRIAVVDQGSSATKGAVVDAAGRIVERTERPIGRRVADGRIEHDPLEIARSVEEVLRELGRQGAVDGIALACQRSTCLLWDREDGRPLTPAASWQDRRAAGAADRLELDHGDEIRRLTGLPPSAHYAGTKLAALLDERPEARRAAERGEVVAGTLDAFLVQRLTGTASTEPGQAGRTLLYDLEADAWSGKLARLLDVPFAALPTLAPSAGERGRVGGLPLLALLGDQQAALLGQGGDRAPIAVVHFGTGAFILVATGDRLVRHPRLSSAVLASTRRERAFQIEGSVNSAGSAVDWAADLLGLDLEAWGDRLVDPRSAPWLLPAFAGVGAPWWRPDAGAVVAGLALDHGAAELFGGVLVGIAQRVVDCLDALDQAGVRPTVLRTSGRLTRLAGLLQCLADLSGLPVEVAGEEEAGILGAALLGHRVLGAPCGGAWVATLRTVPPALDDDARHRLRQDWSRFLEAALAMEVGRPS